MSDRTLKNERLQEIFDSLKAKEAELNEKKNDREDALLSDKEYRKLTDEMRDGRAAKKAIADAWDNRHPAGRSEREALAKEIKELSAQLGTLILNAYLKEEKVEIRNKKGKILSPRYTVKLVTQGRLF